MIVKMGFLGEKKKKIKKMVVWWLLEWRRRWREDGEKDGGEVGGNGGEGGGRPREGTGLLGMLDVCCWLEMEKEERKK